QIRIKFCGITNIEDAIAATDLGAWALGFNFYVGSPRYIAPDRAANIVSEVPDSVHAVGVFVNPPADHIKAVSAATGISMIQLHGDESPAFCSELSGLEIIKAFRPQKLEDLETITSYPPLDYVLLDAASAARFGGTGQLSNWDIAMEAARQHRLVL